MRHIRRFPGILLVFCIFFSSGYGQSCKEKRMHRQVRKSLDQWKKGNYNLKSFQKVKIDSFRILPEEKKLNIYFAPDLSYLPIREAQLGNLNQSLASNLKRRYRDYGITIISNNYRMQDLVPNWDRKELPQDDSRLDIVSRDRIPLVRKPDETTPSKGLYNNNIAMWPSHGIFYESGLDRWEYQRPRLFGTVEDVHPLMYVLQYIVPMLENAGAEVFLPRERDTRMHEVVVDNDTPASGFILPEGMEYESAKGFLPKDTLFPGDKPFESGTSLKFLPEANAGRTVSYVPDIPVKGSYAVYVSYLRDSANSSSVEYVIQHTGGETRFLVNQKKAGSTWVYLGTFDFGTGVSPENGAVEIRIHGKENGFISTDAVRFGGGMGNVARRPVNKDQYQWKLSGKPRYMEAARYYLQYAGMPDTLVYNLNKDRNDYTDDLQSRGEWVNFLIGSSRPQYRSSFNTGLNVPVDLSFAFHTDAGVTPNDSVIGTLCIYSTEKNQGIYPNGQSKMTNRDLADMIQTELIRDIRAQVKPNWTRRAMWDRGYSEAYRQIVPSLLLELLSHQNAGDMRLSLDPRFRFVVGRAIYKGMLKYLAFQQDRPYVVQPLPVDHFSMSMAGNNTVRLSWKPVRDSLEVTAQPDRYKVYTRTGDGGFDNGITVADTSVVLTLGQYDQIYSFKVTALNDGGESFPSEILSAGIKNETAPAVLVVNAFDRVSGPAFFDKEDMAGIAWWEDQGVPYQAEIGHIGNQYDFNRKSEWKDDDSPGWGASYGDMEGKIIPGNTFDFTCVHGKAIMDNGYSFISVSDEVFTGKSFDASLFNIVDVILGEEKSMPSFINKNTTDFQIYTPEFMDKIREIAEKGKGLFLSGAYTGTDLLNTGDSTAIRFAKEVLHFQWRTGHAVTSGDFYATDAASEYFHGKYNFNTSLSPDVYTVEAPDAINPEGSDSQTIFRYRENNTSAGVAYKGKYRSVVCGFPFETISSEQERTDMMAQVLNFLKN